LPVDVRPETVLLVEIPDDLAPMLDDMPGIIWHFDHHPTVSDAYVLPPVRYPDGKRYLKIGADNDRDIDISSLEKKRTFMRSTGSQATAGILGGLVTELIPALRGLATRSLPCMLTYSPTGYPLITEVAPRWYVATAGCGKSAKSSDQIGKLAADLVMGCPWPDGFDPLSFRLP
jgi:sarcosine oxidase